MKKDGTGSGGTVLRRHKLIMSGCKEILFLLEYFTQVAQNKLS
jgi:hypothetical protein